MMTWFVENFLVWWLRSGRYRWSRFHRRFFEGKYRYAVLPSPETLEDLQGVLRTVEWTADHPALLWDCISYPQRTWVLKKDDCDGFSGLAAELLSRLDRGYRPVLLTVIGRPLKYCHTVCVFHDSHAGLRFLDNGVLRPESCNSYAEIAALIGVNLGKRLCWDIINPSSLQILEFHKT